MRVGNAGVNRLDAIHRQNIACWRTRELVGAVARATGNCQGVYAGVRNKLRCLFWIGQQLVVTELARSANTVFFTRLSGFQ